MEIERIVSREEAVRMRPEDGSYDSPEWLIAVPGSGTPLNLHRAIDPQITADLRFISGTSEVPLKFKREYELDEQTISRGVRELSMKSAVLLDNVIRLTDTLPRETGRINVSPGLLQQLSMNSSAFLPEEVLAGAQYHEGSVRTILVNRYERDAKARAACLSHYGRRCQACDQDLATRYGEAAAGLIQVHHLVPLASIRESYQVDPVTDLRPVCPNCHAVIHRREPPYSIAEIRAFLAQGT